MLQSGIQAKCERCRQTEFFPDKETRGDSDASFNSSGWKYKDTRLLCPDCLREYETITKSFFESGGVKENGGCKD